MRRTLLGLMRAVFWLSLVTVAYAQNTTCLLNESSCLSAGQEVAIPVHLQDGQEFNLSIPNLIQYGQTLFTARWTIQEGQGRPMTKGTGAPISDASMPLVFPRNFNRISAPDTGKCSGCHNTPVPGGGGDIVGNVFVLGQRFDFATFNSTDTTPTDEAVDELGNPVTLQTIADSRKTVGMSGSGFIEMLARQMTADLQVEAAACAAGQTCALSSKGISFGTITHNADGTWNTSSCVGLVAPSLASKGTTAPSLVIRPFHQASNVVSLRQFTNNAFNHHHGIQDEERFGIGVDADGDGFVNELTTADVTAATLFQAAMAVPGRVIPSTLQSAIVTGESLFGSIGCGSCHVDSLPLTNNGWVYSEPNPYNPAGNLQATGTPPGYSGPYKLTMDLTSNQLPRPRLKNKQGVVMVPAYTDLKVHDLALQDANGHDLPSCASNPSLTPGTTCDPNVEPLDMNQAAGSPGFFAGNGRFITRKLWGIANQHAFGHHGQYTTMRESILAHHGEAQGSTQAFQALSSDQQNDVIEFLKSLQILPLGTPCLVVDQNNQCINVAGILP
jgi:hypothetical protein